MVDEGRNTLNEVLSVGENRATVATDRHVFAREKGEGCYVPKRANALTIQ